MKVLISGYYGFGNLGDEAVLAAIIKGLRERSPGIEVSVLSGWRRYNLFTLIGELLTCDALISGGGTLFQDATSSRSLWYYAAVVWLAKLFGKPVMVLGQGLGPLRRGFNRALAGFVLKRVDLITLRDEDSLQELRRLGVTGGNVFVTADPAFLLGVTGRPASAGAPKAGLALKQPLVPAATLERLKKKYGLEPVSLVFQPAAVSFQEMLNVIAGLDCLIGMRLHALIFAALAGVPMVGIAYDPKVRSFMRSLGQPCLEQGELARLDETLDRVLANRTAIRQQLTELRPRLAAKAAENFSLFFQYIGQGEAK